MRDYDKSRGSIRIREKKGRDKMKNKFNKGRGTAMLIAVALVLGGLAYYASIILSSTGIGEDMSIKLGLDLAGGVSIT